MGLTAPKSFVVLDGLVLQLRHSEGSLSKAVIIVDSGSSLLRALFLTKCYVIFVLSTLI